MPIGDRLSRLLTAGASLLGVVAVGWIGETGSDGGFIKDIWGQMKIASPGVAMGSVYIAFIIWREWQRDRKEHADRTSDFVKTMNRYARLRELDQGGLIGKRKGVR